MGSTPATPACPSIETIRALWARTETGKGSGPVTESTELEHYFTGMVFSIALRVDAMHRKVKSTVPNDLERELFRHKEEIEKELRLCSDIVHFLQRKQ